MLRSPMRDFKHTQWHSEIAIPPKAENRETPAGVQCFLSVAMHTEYSGVWSTYSVQFQWHIPSSILYSVRDIDNGPRDQVHRGNE